VDRGLVIFHVGGDDAGALTAYDVNTGEVKWSWKGDGPGYGSPVVVDIEGTRQIITITQGKLVGVDASNGMLLWERPFVITNKTNSVTPVVHGRTIIVSGNGEPTRALAIAKRANQWVTDIVWENADIPLRMSDAGRRRTTCCSASPIVIPVSISLSTRRRGRHSGPQTGARRLTRPSPGQATCS
jgi:outer membrane protein assembly factor BamB